MSLMTEIDKETRRTGFSRKSASFNFVISRPRAADEFARGFDDYVVAMINEWLSDRVYPINRPFQARKLRTYRSLPRDIVTKWLMRNPRGD